MIGNVKRTSFLNNIFFTPTEKLRDLEEYRPYCLTCRQGKSEAYRLSDLCFPIYPPSIANVADKEYRSYQYKDYATCVKYGLISRAQHLGALATIPTDFMSSFFNALACGIYSSMTVGQGILCFPFAICNPSEYKQIISNCAQTSLNYFVLTLTTCTSAGFHAVLFPCNLVCPECCCCEYSIDAIIYQVSTRAHMNIQEHHKRLLESYNRFCCGFDQMHYQSFV